MKEYIKNWLRKRRRDAASEKIMRLEREEKFIDSFFLGHTAAEIKMAEWDEEMAQAKKALADNS